MDPDFLDAALARFAADLTVAGEPAVFDAVVERHLDLLLDLQAAGLRWPSVLKLLKQAGAQRLDGADLSPDQFRASVSRARRRRGARTVVPTVTPVRQTAVQKEADRPIEPAWRDVHRVDERDADARAVIQPPGARPAPRRHGHFDPELSEADLDAVRRRLR